MKKLFKVLLCLSVLASSIKSIAQVDTTTTQKLLKYIFQPIDKNQIPTGFLEEYGCPMLPAKTFNGTLTDSNRIDMHLWLTLYLKLQTGWTKTTANPLPAITLVNTTISKNVSSALTDVSESVRLLLNLTWLSIFIGNFMSVLKHSYLYLHL